MNEYTQKEIRETMFFFDGLKWGILLSCPMWIGLGCLIGKYLWIG